MTGFLIDENLPRAVGNIFEARGFLVEYVTAIPEIHRAPDELIFEYAAENQFIVVTRDLGFTNPFRFELDRVPGIMVLRFPNSIRIASLCSLVARLIAGLAAKDFHGIMLVEPALMRRRTL